MQEDMLGTMRTITRSELVVRCVRCGAPTPRAAARIVNASILTDSHSEFDYLCRACDTAPQDAESVELAADD